MMVTVLLPGGGLAGAAAGVCGRRRRSGSASPPSSGAGGRITSTFLAGALAARLQVGAHDDHRLAAERIVGEQPPKARRSRRTARARRRSPAAIVTGIVRTRLLVLAERSAQIIRRHGRKSSRIMRAQSNTAAQARRWRVRPWLRESRQKHRGGQGPPRKRRLRIGPLSSERQSSGSAGRPHSSWCRAAGRAPSSSALSSFASGGT